jgi:heat shock protein HtpX
MNMIKTTVLLAALTALLVVIGNLIWGPNGAILFFFIALGFNLFSYWFSDKIVLAMYRAREVSAREAPEIHGIVSELAENAGLPKPRIYLIPTQSPNAFATGRNPKHAAVAVTEGILNTLSRDELRGVLAHEMAHVKHRDILTCTIAATVAGAITMMASVARWGLLFGGMGRSRSRGGGLELIVMAIVAPLAALIIQMAISRSREYAADKRGAMLAGSPDGLARALAKLDRGARYQRLEASPATASLFIVNPLRSGGLMSLFSTHPPIEERIRRLREVSVP